MKWPKNFFGGSNQRTWRFTTKCDNRHEKKKQYLGVEAKAQDRNKVVIAQTI